MRRTPKAFEDEEEQYLKEQLKSGVVVPLTSAWASQGGAQYFSTLDLQIGYWQLELNESARPKTAFITKYELFEYTKLPIGLSCAPMTFQRCMELIFRGLQWTHLLIYLDDIISFSSDLTEHFSRLEEILKCFMEAGL